jgi:translation initiation factor IF-1
MFRVEVEQGPDDVKGKTLLCTLNGTMRRFRIRVLPGDDVLADVSIYDRAKGRITRRLRSEDEIVPPAVV